ncbi:transcription elongation GreA/GreB family factor [Lutibacter sp. Hel_I_33_5]|uniref:3-oxoacyl-ACP synthase n=1 Tax=Lutibacter sp. Hel_I_33_5 TaxID=1566289 RepID=UPI0011A4BDD3|nr:3-oxoacyl-ACP synthase [Lutibacter sp. Hel_I_33_5]TVZ56352.1 transcription elongation GreA/GreB family factor [Lutibacter sp. Hel_I_33_5]
MKIKQELFNQCKNYVNQRLKTVEKIISDNQKALGSETKSSAGDKHETGRAMLQLEMEKAGQQLMGIQQMKEVLVRIDFSKTSKNIRLGSIVKTNKVNYFLSISCGQLTVENETYFAISSASPIGKLLLGKELNDVFVFNGNTIKIEGIS